MTCATREYLNNYGIPKHPNGLISHNCLLYQLNDIIHDVWEFSHQGNSIKVKVPSNRASNDAEMVRRWCVSGKAIAVRSSLDMSHNILSDQVLHTLFKYTPEPTDLWIICPSRQTITPAVRLLREHLKLKCLDVLTQLMNKGIITTADIDG